MSASARSAKGAVEGSPAGSATNATDETAELAIAVPLPDAAATERLGADLAVVLRAGDLVFLHGDLGAGKTTLARGLVRWLADAPDADVPSPTFTLVQPYETEPPVLHADLYRVADPAELDELGLDEGLETGVVLVEWPERGAAALPEPALDVRLEEGPPTAEAGRVAHISGPALPRVRRTLTLRAFLHAIGKGAAARHHLTGDASLRAYETIRETVTTGDTLPPILMNAPAAPDGPPLPGGLPYGGLPYSRVAHLAEDVRPFVAVGAALRRRGLAAPQIHAADLDAGILLLENFGTGTIAPHGAPHPARYRACAALLATHMDWALDGPLDLPLPDGTTCTVPLYDRGALRVEVDLLAEWYVRDVHGRELTASERDTFAGLWDALFDRLEAAPRTLVLRDYHSPNIVWRPWRDGADRIGIIDYQDALVGPHAYDLASLAQDARVDVAPELEAELVAHYCATRDPGTFDEALFRETYAVMAAQRASKILGIFVRLDLRDGKPHYRAHLPRMQGYVARALAHPALRDLRSFYASAFHL